MTDKEFSGPIIEYIRSKTNCSFEQYSVMLNGKRMADLQYMHGKWHLVVYGSIDKLTRMYGWREKTFETFSNAVAEIAELSAKAVAFRIRANAIRTCRHCGNEIGDIRAD